MITCYTLVNGMLTPKTITPDEPLPQDALWIDLLSPTDEEEQFLEKSLAVNIPTREEMAEIEESSRLYESERALHMTTTVVSGFSEQQPTGSVLNFVLTPDWLVTVRYAELSAFHAFRTKLSQHPGLHKRSDTIFISLLDSLVDRIADILESVQAHHNRLANAIFREPKPDEEGPKEPKSDLQSILKQLGRSSLLLARLSDSLLGINRLLSYLHRAASEWICREAKAWMKTVERDSRSLGDYQNRMNNEISFLLDATLGLINIEQNGIIKVFSIAAVLFLPPTLVGTVYGMNFENMPELGWHFGYPLALVGMVVSAIIPYAWFKFRGWL
ncbi:magnesium transporter CorA family protein [Pseudomonas asuensis]|uniref:Magnesium/cobalt transporter n=1 Tax=Pseudomonas asuensis TaxID=1825787 RepID=A0ABQ2GSK8_9PSED|nr:magnesium transporter CorA family protein [Pseudomonas asuensis]GGM09433.1 magnesium/cobalt transporter [Pseudomonas asuensis]